MKSISRRKMLQITAATAGMSIFGLPVSLAEEKNNIIPSKKKKVLVIGAHPDDAETGCGGTIILLSHAGYEVVSCCLTRGEAGINGKSHKEAAQIRTQEAKKAGEIMGARVEFLSQIDGNCEITGKRYTEMYEFIEKENPDVVITHWPIDGHRDHRICSLLVYDAWLKCKRQFALYYFEVESGQQTQHFFPSDFVNIEPVLKEKHLACYAHESQHMDDVYKLFHATMEKFRGIQAGYNYAEAFVKHNQVATTF